MTFFYNLNKKLEEIRATPSKTHGQLNEHSVSAAEPKSKLAQALNERDMSRAAKGYEKYGKQGMQALAKAGREGKALDPVRAKYNKYDESQLNELSPELLKKARDKAGMKYAQADDRRDQKASDKYNRQDDKFNSALRKKQKDMDEGSIQGGVWTATPPKPGQPNVPAPTDPEGVPASKMTPTPKPAPVSKMPSVDTMGNATGISKSSALPPATKDVNKARVMPLPEQGQSDAMGKLGQFNRMPGTNITKPAISPRSSSPNMPTGTIDRINKVIPKNTITAEEGGIPMTAKQKSFAALAEPPDKITFADKIAGAKKEVDEMLGDVAAEAMKSALSGHSTKSLKAASSKDADADRKSGVSPQYSTQQVKGELKRRGEQVADEGFDDMERDVKSRMSARRVGDVTHGDKHDTQEIPGGRRVTRRVDPNTGYSVGADSDASADGEKRGRGRPKGADKGPERVTGRATKHKGGRKTNEGDLEITDRGEYDQEGDMAKDSIKTVVRHAQALEKILGDNDNLPEWVQSKLAKIESMMTAVDDYMQNQEDDEEMAMGEEKTSTRDNRAEKAGRKVAKDIEYDEKKKDGIHGKKRGSEDARAEKAGKKVAKDIEYDEKKKKKTEEAGGTSTPTASSGFSFGQGIYDSVNRELEEMIAESMNISMSSNSDGANGPTKSLTVTATDEDASYLAQILKSAGLGGGQQGGCGGSEAEHVDENSPDWPTNTETLHDALQYSGGLNKPKSTGQTTVPVIATQEERQGTYNEAEEDALRRMMEMAGIKEAPDLNATVGIKSTAPTPAPTPFKGPDLNTTLGIKTTPTPTPPTPTPASTSTAPDINKLTIDAMKEEQEEDLEEDSLDRLRKAAGVQESKKDVEEEKTDEGNKYLFNVLKAKQAGKKEADLDGDGDMEKVRESILDIKHLWSEYKG